MFGKKRVEYGVRFGGKDTWGYGTKAKAEAACKRMNKSVKAGGTRAKLTQRTVKLTAIKGREKDKCVGGKCNKRGNVCKKHFRSMSGGRGGDWSLDGVNARWDEEGHRWG